ncbi:MAG: phospholipase domain-containing protein [Asticcacaulis sp.]
MTVTWRDESYGQPPRSFDLTPGGAQTVALDFSTSHNWYDFSVAGDGFSHRFAGHIEDGQTSLSDPALGGPARLKV